MGERQLTFRENGACACAYAHAVQQADAFAGALPASGIVLHESYLDQADTPVQNGIGKGREALKRKVSNDGNDLMLPDQSDGFLSHDAPFEKGILRFTQLEAENAFLLPFSDGTVVVAPDGILPVVAGFRHFANLYFVYPYAESCAGGRIDEAVFITEG